MGESEKNGLSRDGLRRLNARQSATKANLGRVLASQPCSPGTTIPGIPTRKYEKLHICWKEGVSEEGVRGELKGEGMGRVGGAFDGADEEG